jgi:hypothetical protein
VRLLSKSPGLVHRPQDEIQAEAHSPNEYALRFVRTALADEAGAAKLLLNSWQASKDSHRGVLYWLTGGLEAELMGRNTEAPSSETSPEHDLSGAEQPPPAITGETSSERVTNAERTLRELLSRRPELRWAKRGTVIKEAGIRKQDGLAALRQLEQTGEYTGPSEVARE